MIFPFNSVQNVHPKTDTHLNEEMFADQTFVSGLQAQRQPGLLKPVAGPDHRNAG